MRKWRDQLTKRPNEVREALTSGTSCTDKLEGKVFCRQTVGILISDFEGGDIMGGGEIRGEIVGVNAQREWR